MIDMSFPFPNMPFDRTQDIIRCDSCGITISYRFKWLVKAPARCPNCGAYSMDKICLAGFKTALNREFTNTFVRAGLLKRDNGKEYL